VSERLSSTIFVEFTSLAGSVNTCDPGLSIFPLIYLEVEELERCRDCRASNSNVEIQVREVQVLCRCSGIEQTE
jgi:hypothetical protein